MKNVVKSCMLVTLFIQFRRECENDSKLAYLDGDIYTLNSVCLVLSLLPHSQKNISLPNFKRTMTIKIKLKIKKINIKKKKG